MKTDILKTIEYEFINCLRESSTKELHLSFFFPASLINRVCQHRMLKGLSDLF